MSGIYGSSYEDRCREAELNRYLSRFPDDEDQAEQDFDARLNRADEKYDRDREIELENRFR